MCLNQCFNLIQTCRDMLSQDWKVIIQHTFREGNRTADGLANLALKYQKGVYFLEECPAIISDLLCDDMLGMTWPRSIRD